MSSEVSQMEVEEGSDEDYEFCHYSDDDLEEYVPKIADIEFFEYQCLNIQEVEKLLNDSVETLCAILSVPPALAKTLLHTHKWDISKISAMYSEDSDSLLEKANICPKVTKKFKKQITRSSRGVKCHICLENSIGEQFRAVACGHNFCIGCWTMYFEDKILQGLATKIECMGQNCHLLVPEDFILGILTKSSLREKFQKFAFSDYVKSHPHLRYCPGPNCNLFFYAQEFLSKRVACINCKTICCFKCGKDYHAPVDCETIRKWLTKYEDGKEDENYILANTKDCPKCHINIEKSGGCNHMHCSKCNIDFCWLCLGEWKMHFNGQYRCSKYQGQTDTKKKSKAAQAREALQKYLFYHGRWENHARSLKLEEETLQRVKDLIESKVMANEGTWIDWQYLLNAASLLAKCRYTLQYTYPYAYFMESGPRKGLFEYQQSELETEIENLSWKIERAETTDRGDIQNQMNIAEKRREILWKEFGSF